MGLSKRAFLKRGFAALTLTLAACTGPASVLETAASPAPSFARTLSDSPSDLPPTAPFHAVGAKLFDANEQEVRITGVNWFGLETSNFAPHGLWTRSLTDMLDQVVALGFNTIRLPYSNQLFDPASRPNGIDFQKNPALQGLTGPQV